MRHACRAASTRRAIHRPSTRAAAGVALALAAMLAAGCGTLDRIAEANRIDYKSTAPRQRSTLDVPPDLSAPRADDRFAIPSRSGAATGAPTEPATLSAFQRGQASGAPRPPEARIAPQAPGARMERAGSQRWLVVDQPPAALWPKVREFWTESGFVLATEQPDLGILETDWAENRAKLPQDLLRRTVGRVLPGLYDTSERDRFRTRLEPTADGGTEIYVSHRGAEEIATGAFKDQARWQMRPSDPELEAEFMRRLLVKLGAEQQRAEQVVAEGGTPQQARARLTGDALVVDEGFDRAWRRVGLALDRVGFTVEDRDRTQGLFYVRYADVEGNAAAARKPGLLDRVLGRNRESAIDARRYRIKVQGAGDASQVQVLDRDGQPTQSNDDRRIASRILALLQDQLK